MTLPTGLTWRAEFAPQHDDGKEKPVAGSSRKAAPTTEATSTDPKATEKGGPPPQPCADTNLLLMMGAMFVFVWFFMIRPSRKQEKDLKDMRSGLVAGDRIVTTSGMHGSILSVDEKAQTVTIQADEEGRVRMTFDTAAVSRKAADDKGASQDKA